MEKNRQKDQTDSYKKTKQSRQGRGKSQFSNKLYEILIYAILKVYAKPENPLSAREVAAYMEQWISGEYSYKLIKDADKKYQVEVAKASKGAKPLRVGTNNFLFGEPLVRSVRETLSMFTLLFDTANISKTGKDTKTGKNSVVILNADIHMVLFLVGCFGGIARCVDYSKRPARYYFDPFLSDADLSILKGGIITNQYLSTEEKELLLQACPLLSGGDQVREWAEHTIKKNLKKENADETDLIPLNKLLGKKSRPSDESINGIFLKNMGLIYENLRAPSPKTIILEEYGRYGEGKDAKKTATIDALNNYSINKTYKLNPYGFVWHNGHCYLIATHFNYTNPSYFRVSRILKMSLGQEERKPIPDTIAPYMLLENGKAAFSPEKYLHEHPMMARFNTVNIVTAKLECTAKSASMVVDAFGNVPLIEIENTRGITDNGNLLKCYIATVKAQYEDILEFCTEYHKDVLAAERDSQLYRDVKDRLAESLRWYQ